MKSGSFVTATGNRNKNTGSNPMKTNVSKSIGVLLSIFTFLLISAEGADAAEWGDGKAGAKAGQATQRVTRQTVRAVIQCGRDFQQGYRIQQTGSGFCQSAGNQARKATTETKAFIGNLLRK